MIDPDSAYTIKALAFDGTEVVVDSGSCQGTVILISNFGWYGSCHGREYLNDIRLYVDGQEAAVQDGMHYQGSWFRLVKESSLGGLAILQSEILVIENAIREKATVTFLYAIPVAKFYPFLSSHNNAFTEVVGIESPDAVLQDGQTGLDDDSMFDLPGSDVIGQYDPNDSVGIATHFAITGMDDGSYPFIWDRPNDNKLYFRLVGSTNPVPIGAQFSSTTTRVLFRTTSVDWQDSVAIPLFGNPVRDGLVDLADFAEFEQCLQSPQTPATGVCTFWFDADDDQDVDLRDFAEMQRAISNQ
ncbi:MAG TPA: hypothetical protein PKN33_08925 [Phycisphaerae bacterium]|nr:hypothetical protein [Phycisphaerae bacterium]